VQAIRHEKAVLWRLAGQAFPESSQVFNDLDGETSKALRVTGAFAATLRQMTVEAFIAQVWVAYSGKRLFVSKLRRTHQLAATSIGATEGLQAIQLAIQVHLAHLQASRAQLEQVTCAVTACLTSLPEAPYLLSVKSLKAVSAAIFLAEVGDHQRYQATAQWVKLAGIQPAPNTSRKKQRSQTPMSHQGRSRLRTLLYFTCLRMVQQDNHFA